MVHPESADEATKEVFTFSKQYWTSHQTMTLGPPAIAFSRLVLQALRVSSFDAQFLIAHHSFQ